MEFCEFLIDQFAALGGIQHHFDNDLLVILAMVDFQTVSVFLYQTTRLKLRFLRGLGAKFTNHLVYQGSVGIGRF